jgi:hypothetical protein
VSGHLRAPAALIPMKEAAIAVGQEAGWGPERSGRCGAQ